MLIGAPILTEIAEGLVSLTLASAAVQGLAQTVSSLLKEWLSKRGNKNIRIIESISLEQLKVASCSIRNAEVIIDQLIRENESLRAEIKGQSSAVSTGE